MKNEPTVSIVINNYNYDRFLSQAIDSALNQTYSNVEVIVVDDCSTDNSRQVIAEYGDRITPILHEKNSKQSAALNSGFAASHGDIIIFLDADDYLFSTAAERIVADWNPEIGKIHYRLQVVDTERQPLGNFLPPNTMQLDSGEVWHKLLHTSGYVSTPMSGNAYGRTCLAKVLPIPKEYETTGDDYLMISTPFYGKVCSIEDALGAYRIHTSNQWALTTVSGSRFRRFVLHDLQNFVLLQKRAKEFNLEIPPDLEMREIGRIWSRLASLRLEPQKHPVPSDSVPTLLYWGLRSLWNFSSYNWQKRIIYSLWLLWVGLMPISLAKLGITWLYAPHFRPKLIDWTLTRIRALVS